MSVGETRAASDVPRLRVGVFGGFGIGNFGNDASLEAVLAYLAGHHPEAEVTCICTNPAALPKSLSARAIATVLRPKGAWRVADTLLLRQPSVWTNLARSLAVMGRLDVLLIAGTGVFDDFRDTPLGWPSRVLRWCVSARARGAKVVFLSVGAGPILNPLSRSLFKAAARLAQHRSYRDAKSRDFMQRLGVDERASLVLPDLAFLLAPAPAPARAGDAPLILGVGMMNYRGWRDSAATFEAYIDTHARLIAWIDAKGFKTRILIGQTPTDLVAVRALEQRVGRSLMSPREETMNSFHDAMSAAAATDVVIASRYHVQIAALKMRRPLFSLSYAPKNDALLADVGLEAFTQDIHHVDFDALTRQIETLVGRRAEYGAIVDARMSAMEARLRDALATLDLPGAQASAR